jgi:hypothetical protein
MVRFAVLCGLAFIALAGWAVSSPIGSSPDDDYHLGSIWCASTAPTGSCTVDGDVVVIPTRLVWSSGCYAFQADISGLCVMSIPADQKGTTGLGRVNQTGLYPQGYYDVMGLLVGQDIIRSVYLMRILNVLLAVILAAIALALAPVGLRQAGLLGILATCGPLGWFLIGSNNPSGWAIIAIALIGVAFLAHALAPGSWRSRGAFAMALVFLAMAVGSRADAAAYAVVVTGALWVGLMLHPGVPRPRKISATVLAAVTTTVGLIGYRSAAQGDLAVSNVYGGGVRSSEYVFQNIVNLPDVILGGLGYWNLGWLDTPLPKGVPILATLLVGGIVIAGLRFTPRWYGLPWLIIVAALIAIPLRVYYVNGMVVGELIQPRYLLPLLPICVALPILRGNGEFRFKWSRGQSLTIGLVVFIVFSVSLHVNIRRYVTGTDSVALNLTPGAEWWSSTTIGPMTVWIISIAAAAAFLALARRTY